MIPRRIVVWSLCCIGLGFGASFAEAGGARLYEVTENMKLMAKGAEIDRVATAQLLGFADRGTPLCPEELAGDNGCVINATGEDVVSLGNGQGIVRGRFTVVAHGDNPVDAPELVVLRGRFKGTMDFSPALLRGLPYGTVTGHFRVSQQTLPFSGIFRLPVLVFVDPAGRPCDPTKQSPCVQITPRPVYLIDPDQPGSFVEVADTEYAIGFPTVRFDVEFGEL
jgi:hypothetical protein